ncbi:MAG: glycine cleavage system protein GcvH [Deltaproteobacteria bacterium]|nr:glycine cleavage system protein GcvH [Deltaproteobacteria bacterium]
MSNLEFPSDRRYTKDHEWARKDGQEILVGVSAFAVEQLGDITLVNVDVKVGDSVEVGKSFGTIESVKTLSDMFAPVSGKITKINEALNDKPELINEDCNKTWMVAIAPSNPAEFEALLDQAAYAAHVKASAH